MATETKTEHETRGDLLSNVLFRLGILQSIGVLGPDGDIMIDAREAAAIANVDVNTVFTWGQNAKIARYKLGGAVRFGLREFCGWIESCRQPAIKKKSKNR